MLMNGKEVKHLVINGEEFSKKVFGQQCYVNNNIVGSCTIDDQGNVVDSDLPMGYTHYFAAGHNNIYTIAAEVKGAYYLTSSSPLPRGWVDKKYVVLVDD